MITMGIIAYTTTVPITFLGFTIGYEKPYAQRAEVPFFLGFIMMLAGVITSSVKIKVEEES